MKIIIVSILFITCSAFYSAAQINLDNGLRAQYDFSGNANDIAGNGFDGTINGATLTNDRLEIPNSAFYFDGTNQNIEVSGFQNMISADEISISCWVKADQVKTQGVFTLYPDDQSDRIFAGPYYNHNGVSSTFWDYGDISNSGRLGSVGTFFQPGWEHYVYISSASQNLMQVYRNGYLQLFKTGSSSVINKNRPLCIGGNIAGIGNANCFFKGAIDDIRIYDRVLNPAEIMSIFHGYYTSTVNDLRVFVTNYPNARPGFQEQLNVVYQNVGTTTLNGYVELNYDALYNFVQATPVQDSTNSNYLGWYVNNITPGSQGVLQALVYLPASVPLGTMLSSSATIYPLAGDSTPWDNLSSLRQTVVGGCDPNYIEVSPDSDITPDFVTEGDYLYYTIHFQNTGTANAINIRIEDSLESDFIISSVEVIGASHPYTSTLDNSNKLTFFFDNINLLDSGTSFFGSSGFVMFKTKALPTLQAGAQLSNNANIFFDFNQPVLTNTVVTNIINPLSIPVTENTSDNSFTVFPNPSDILSLNYFSGAKNQPVSITILSSNGSLVKEINFISIAGKNKIDLNLKSSDQGIYFIKVSDGTKTAVKKWIKF